MGEDGPAPPRPPPTGAADLAPAGRPPPGGLSPALAAGLLVAAVAAAYATSFAGAFQFDDWNVIVLDPRVQSLRAWWAAQPALRPLLGLSFAWNHQAGLGLAGFHAVNLAIHLGATLLALRLLVVLEGWFAGEGSRSRSVPPAALLGALLLALHPVQTEAVTYLSGRSSALAALLALGSLLAWLEGRARGRPWLSALLSPLLLLASLGVKETAAVLPLALLLLAAVEARAAPGPGARPWRGALPGLLPHMLVVALAAGAALASPSYRAMLSHAAGLRPPVENLVAHLGGLAWLAGQVVAPGRLLADPGPPAPPTAAALGVAALAAVALAAALAFGLQAALGRAARPGRRAAGLAVLWCLLWLPPTGWLLPRPEVANHRQLYLALLGPAWLAGRALSAWLAAPGWRRGAAAVGAAGLVLWLGALTARRSLVYADELTFWSDVVAQAPRNARAHNNLGLAYSAACRLEEARRAFLEALRLEPGHPRARVNLWLLEEGEPPGQRPDARPACPAPTALRPPAVR